MKVHQRGACPHHSVGLSYISLLLEINFTTPKIPFFTVKLCGVEAVDATHIIWKLKKISGEWSSFWWMAQLSRRRELNKTENLLLENMLQSSRFSQRLLIRLQFSCFLLGFWDSWWLNVPTFRRDILPFFSERLNCLVWMFQWGLQIFIGNMERPELVWPAMLRWPGKRHRLLPSLKGLNTRPNNYIMRLRL
jgi:hypothetical protein